MTKFRKQESRTSASELRQHFREMGRNHRLLESITIIPSRPGDSKKVSDLKTRIHDEPLNSGLYNDLGVLLTNEGRPVEAVRVLRQGLKIDPHDSDLWCNLGIALIEQDSESLAKGAFEKAISLSPEIPAYYINLTNLHLRRRMFDEAIAILDRFLGGEQDDPAVRVNLALAYKQKKLYGLAIDQLEIAEQLTADPEEEDLVKLNAYVKRLIKETKALRYMNAPDTKASIRQIAKDAMEQ